MALISVSVAVTAFTLFYLVLGTVLRPRLRVASRLNAVEAAATTNGAASKPAKVRRRRTVGWTMWLDAVLRRAEIDIPVREFALRWLLLTLCAGLVLLLAVGVPGLLFAIAVSGLGTLLYLRARGQRRLRRFNDGLHDMLITVCNALRAGHSFAQALQVAADEMDGPIREELRRIEAEMQLGVGVEEALERANDRVGSDDFDLVVTAILIQRQIGGNLAEVLEKITETIRERVRLKQEVKALTAQGRMSATIFMLLPVGVGSLLFVLNPNYIGVMFSTPLGWALLAVAAVGQGIGYVLIRRIVDVEL